MTPAKKSGAAVQRRRSETYAKWILELHYDMIGRGGFDARDVPLDRYVCVEKDAEDGLWLTLKPTLPEACEHFAEMMKTGRYRPEFIIDLDEDARQGVVVEVIVTPLGDRLVTTAQ